MMNARLFAAVSVFFITASQALAADCSSPPTGAYGSAWAQQYQSWCVSCCGSFSMSGGNPSCSPGSNWGCAGGQGSLAAGSAVYNGFYQMGNQIGEGIGKFLFGDPQEKARAEQLKVQQHQQAMQSVDIIAREQMSAEDEMLHNAADQERRIDDQRRDETLSSLTGIPQAEELALKSSADFAPTKKVQAVESRTDHAYQANCGKVDPNRTMPITTDLCPGNLVAMTYFCGGVMGCPYVCCPKGLPYLNHCDCKCYATEHFECPTLSKCEVQQRQ